MKKILSVFLVSLLFVACSHDDSMPPLLSTKGNGTAFVYLEGVNKNGNVVTQSPAAIVKEVSYGDQIDLDFEVDKLEDVQFFNVKVSYDGKPYEQRLMITTVDDLTIYKAKFNL